MTPAQSAALRRRRVGYVLQHHNLLPDLTATQNVAMPLILDGVRPDFWRRRAAGALELTGIASAPGISPTTSRAASNNA